MKQPAILSNKSAAESSMENTSPATLNLNLKQNQKQKQKQQMGQKRKLPTAQELITHYESKGVDSKEAASKVIDDLQRALYKVVTSSGKKNATGREDSSRKVDMINASLVRLERKLDSKPGFGESLTIGLASGAALSGLGNVLPHVCYAVGQMWTTVRSNFNSSSSSSSGSS